MWLLVALVKQSSILVAEMTPRSIVDNSGHYAPSSARQTRLAAMMDRVAAAAELRRAPGSPSRPADN